MPHRIQHEIDATDKEINIFIRDVSNIFQRITKKQLKNLDPEDVDVIVQQLGSLERVLSEAGLTEAIAKLQEVYGKQLDFIQERFAALGKKEIFTDLDRTLIEELIKFDVEQIASRINLSTAQVKRNVTASILGGQQPDIDQIVDGTTDEQQRNLETSLTTAVQGFNRAVSLKKATDLGFERFQYVGAAEDDVMRDFCRERLNKIFTLKEIEEWDNGQGLDAAIYLGGYNCRHQLVVVDDD